MPTELTASLVTDLLVPRHLDLSPDGRRVAWSAQPFGKKGEHSESAIFVADVGGPPRRWTHGGGEDKQPRWSPDGRLIAFLSDRKKRGIAGLYLLATDGGEGRPLVVRKRGIDTFAWSPDGARLAFVAQAEPGEEDERREKERDDAAVYGERLALHRLWVVELDSGKVTQVGPDDVHVAGLTWSPDGRQLAYLARTTPELDKSTAHTLFVTALEGEPRMICAAPWAETIAWAQGSDRLVFGAPHEVDPQAGETVWAVDLAGGEPEVIGSQLTDGFCSCLMTAAIPGERRAVVLIAEGLTTRLEWRDPDTGVAEVIGELADWPEDLSVRLTPDGPVIAAIHGSRDRTFEVWAGAPGAMVPVSNHHELLADIRLGSVEDFAWQSADGRAMDAILIRPPGASTGPLPLVVLPHGGPYGRSSPSLQLRPQGWGQWLAVAGYAVLMPNYRGGHGHGSEFAKLARGDMGGAEFGDIMAAVDAAIARRIADPDRLAIGGWSQGGFLTAWAVTQTDRFKAAIMGAGVSDWSGMSVQSDLPSFESVLAGGTPWDGRGPERAAERSPLSFAAKVTTPLLILHGEKDERVPLPQATGFHRALLDHGANVRLVTFPREGHGIAEAGHQRQLMAEVRAWLGRYL